jgi:hypothetical protein
MKWVGGIYYARLSPTHIAGISKGSTHTIMKNHLKVKRITARWYPNCNYAR